MRNIKILSVLLVLFCSIFFSGISLAAIIKYDNCETARWTTIWTPTQVGGTIALSSAQHYAGSNSYRFILNAGGKRAEIVPNPQISMSFGGDFWIGYAMYIPSDFARPTSWGMSGQMHGSPHTAAGDPAWGDWTINCDQCGPRSLFAANAQPLAMYWAGAQGTSATPQILLSIAGSGQFCQKSCDGCTDCTTHWSNKSSLTYSLNRGQWNRIVLHYVPEYNNSEAITELWHNGTKEVLTGANCTNDPIPPYFKFGIYGSTTTPVTVYLDEIRFGQNSSYAEVRPDQIQDIGPPAFTEVNLDDQCISAGTLIAGSAVAVDPDGGVVTYRWTDNSGYMNSASSFVSYGSAWNNGESHVLMCTATDTNGYSSSVSRTITTSASCGGGEPVTITLGERSVDDYQGVTADNYIVSWGTDLTKNTSGLNSNGPNTSEALISLDLSQLTGLTVTGASFFIRPISITTDCVNGDWGLYASSVAWTEAGATYNCAVDTAHDGTCDVAWTGTRGKGSLLSSLVTVENGSAYQFYEFTGSGLVDAVSAAVGGTLRLSLDTDQTTTGYVTWASSENSTTENRPYLEVTYLQPTGGLHQIQWVTPDGTRTAGDYIQVQATWPGGETLSSGGQMTMTTSAGGAAYNLVSYVGDGTEKTVYLFGGTVPASATTSGSELTITGLSVTSGTFTGSLTLPSAPFRVQDTGSIYLDSSAPAGFTSMVAADCDTGADLTGQKLYKRGERICVKLCVDDAVVFAEGLSENFALPLQIDSGGPIVVQWNDWQNPDGFGSGHECFLMQGIIGSDDYETNNVEAATVNALVRDYTTPSSNSIIRNAAGEEIASYALPQVGLGISTQVWGGPGIFFKAQ